MELCWIDVYCCLLIVLWFLYDIFVRPYICLFACVLFVFVFVGVSKLGLFVILCNYLIVAGFVCLGGEVVCGSVLFGLIWSCLLVCSLSCG